MHLQPDPTTHHVRAACLGSMDSVDWIVRRLTPHLMSQARLHLRGLSGADHAPEDLVQEVWAVALLRLGELQVRDGRMTPVLVAFLARTMRNKTLNWLRERARADALQPRTGPDAAMLPVSTRGVIREVIAREADDLVAKAIAQLDEPDREILVLRGLEQTSYEDLSQVLGVAAGALRMRYARARERLREHLPESIFDEIDD